MESKTNQSFETNVRNEALSKIHDTSFNNLLNELTIPTGDHQEWFSKNSADLYSIGTTKPTIKFKRIVTLTNNGRFNLTRELDILSSFKINCNSPDDIKSVTLFVKKSIPKDPILAERYMTGEMSSKDDIFYQQEKLTNTYIPIDRLLNTITKPFTSNRFEFCGGPLPIYKFLFESLSVAVEFNENFRIPRQFINVELECFWLTEDYRNPPNIENAQSKVVCIVGKRASGKTTLAEQIENVCKDTVIYDDIYDKEFFKEKEFVLNRHMKDTLVYIVQDLGSTTPALRNNTNIFIFTSPMKNELYERCPESMKKRHHETRFSSVWLENGLYRFKPF